MKLGAAHGVRLNMTYFHFPSAVAKVKKDTTVCQFHRLANKVINNSNNNPPGSRKEVIICKDCDVALCVRCWEGFHTKIGFETEDYCRILSDHN